LASLKQTFIDRGFKLKEIKSKDSFRQFEFTNKVDGAEDEIITIGIHKRAEGPEIRYTESQLRDGNPGYIDGQTNVFENIVYNGYSIFDRSVPDNNHLLRRYQTPCGVQDWGESYPGSTTIVGYQEFLDLQTGRFGNRTKLEVTQE